MPRPGRAIKHTRRTMAHQVKIITGNYPVLLSSRALRGKVAKRLTVNMVAPTVIVVDAAEVPHSIHYRLDLPRGI